MPEEEAVPDPLQDAIEAEFRSWIAEHDLQPSTVLTNYVVIAAARGWDADDNDVEQVMICPSGPQHVMLGLIEHARIRMHAEVVGLYRSDDDD